MKTQAMPLLAHHSATTSDNELGAVLEAHERRAPSSLDDEPVQDSDVSVGPWSI